MVNVNSFLNVKNSTRNLTDEYFNSIVDDIAESLSHIDIHPVYTDNVLYKDWKQLKDWSTDSSTINSTSRLGMKLCEHFFPNFYDITNNKGESFHNLWNKNNLIKILKWNRNSHSTPYLSELKRGIYFCCGLTKNTMYRPQMSKMICDYYKPKIVLDPCAGWGGRLMGAVSSGAYYIAFEPNTETYNNLLKLIDFLGISDRVQLICDDAMNMLNYDLPKVDLIITSPPYFDLEIYTNESSQSITNHCNYKSWSEYFLYGIIEKSTSLLNNTGISCWNVGKVGKNDMNIDVLEYHTRLGFTNINEFSVISSKRQSLQKSNNKKSMDNTTVFTRNYMTHEIA